MDSTSTRSSSHAEYSLREVMRPLSNLRLLGVLALTAASSIRLSAATLVVGNLDQLREAARRGADSLLGAFRAGDTVRVEVGRTQGSWLLEVALLERAAASGITLRTAPETQTGPAVRAYVSRAAITYDLQSDGDSVRRRADLYIESIAARSPAMLPDEPVTEALHIQIIDTIAISDSSLVAGPEPFLAPPFPIRSSEGFWELVAEPAIVLGAAVIMTILLFSVRSSER